MHTCSLLIVRVCREHSLVHGHWYTQVGTFVHWLWCNQIFLVDHSRICAWNQSVLVGINLVYSDFETDATL